MQNDLLTNKSVVDPKTKNVHEDADHEFVENFNPGDDEVDRLLYELITK